MKLNPIAKALWAAVALTCIGLLAVFMTRPELFSNRNSMQGAIIADFELTDQNRQVVRTDDFAGRWMLVFFGYTNCPDVCPTTLAELSAVLEGLGSRQGEVQPIMITIDPARDTPEVLAEYLGFFRPGLVGLTGTPEQIETTSKTFGIFYLKDGDPDAPDGYGMTHSSSVYLFSPKGEFVRSYSYGTPAEAILDDLSRRLSL